MQLFKRLGWFVRFLRYRFNVERGALKYLLGRRIAGGSVLDIGAHRGEFSYWMHNQFPDGTRVVAFEPQPELASELNECKNSLGLERLSVEPLGLSSRRGKLPLHRPRGNYRAATVDDFRGDETDAEIFDVPVTTVDEYVESHPELRPVKLIKCDVEYHEADVLAGAERTLREDRPQILVEWSTPRRAYRERMFRLAKELGYAIFQFEYGQPVPCTTAERRSPPSWELGGNYLLLPSGTPESGVKS
jgi:FkbM family methyltransferase